MKDEPHQLICDYFNEHFKKHPEDENKIPKWYLSRIKNRTMDVTLGKLIEISLLIGKIPIFEFISPTTEQQK